MKFIFKGKHLPVMDATSAKPLRMVLFIKRLLRGWSYWMGHKTAGFSKAQWIWITTIFLLLGGSCSSYILFRSLKKQRSYSFTIQEFQQYDKLIHVGESQKKRSFPVGDELTRFLQYRNYMDSLARSPTGKTLYDSITKRDAGLMENLDQVIKFYKHKSNQ